MFYRVFGMRNDCKPVITVVCPNSLWYLYCIRYRKHHSSNECYICQRFYFCNLEYFALWVVSEAFFVFAWRVIGIITDSSFDCLIVPRHRCFLMLSCSRRISIRATQHDWITTHWSIRAFRWIKNRVYAQPLCQAGAYKRYWCLINYLHPVLLYHSYSLSRCLHQHPYLLLPYHYNRNGNRCHRLIPCTFSIDCHKRTARKIHVVCSTRHCIRSARIWSSTCIFSYSIPSPNWVQWVQFLVKNSQHILSK